MLFIMILSKLDAYVSGENREKLIKNYLNNSFVFISNNLIEGFYIPDLGEGPIFALSTDAGMELMRFKYSTVYVAIIPGDNQAGIEFIKELGFKASHTTPTRMLFGRDIEWRPEMIYSRIGGNLG